MSLNAYQYQVFMDFRIVEENVWNHYYNLASYLDGRGVPSIDEALKETFLRPIHEAFRELVNADMLGRLTTAIFGQKFDKNLSNMIENKMEKLMGEVQKFSSGNGKLQKELKNLSDTFKVVSYLPILDKKVKCPKSRKISSVTKIAKNLQSKNENRYILLVWLVVHRLGAAVNPSAVSEESRAGLDEWLLTKILESTFYELDFNQETVQRFLLLIKILTSHQRWWKNRDIDKKKTYEIMLELLKDSEVQIYLQVNRNRDILWFNKETFQDLLGWLLVIAVIQLLVEGEEDADYLCKAMIERFDIIAQLQKAEKKSEYRVEKLLESLKK